MKSIKRITSAAIAVLMAVLLCQCPGISFADTFVSGSIPASCNIADGIPDDRKDCTYELTQGSLDAPMPEGSIDGARTVHMTESGDIDFGEISFSHPDVYYYTLRETTAEWKRFKRDKNVYSAQVVVGSEGNVKVTYKDSDGGKTEKAVFSNEYRSRTRNSDYSSPKMGDSIREFVLACASLLCALIILVFIVRRWRRHYE